MSLIPEPTRPTTFCVDLARDLGEAWLHDRRILA